MIKFLTRTTMATAITFSRQNDTGSRARTRTRSRPRLRILRSLFIDRPGQLSAAHVNMIFLPTEDL